MKIATALAVMTALTTAACAGTHPEPAPAPTAATQPQMQSAAAGLTMYEGTYTLQAPARSIDMRIWVDGEGKLNGQLVGLSSPTVFRAAGEHRFLHSDADDIWVLFTVENGRATSALMHQRGREISGPRSR